MLSTIQMIFQEIDLYALFITIFIGIVLGILINYLADVLPLTRRFSQPTCPKCNHKYSLKEYVFLLKCPVCGHKKNIRHVLVLICVSTISLLLKLFPFYVLNYLATLPLLLFLGVIVVIDFEHRLVLIETSLFGLFLCLAYGILFHGFIGALIGALGGLLIMLSFYFLGIAFGKIISKLRHRAIDEVPFGFGDVLVGTMLGMLTGWPAIFGSILVGILAFAAYAVIWLMVLVVLKRYKAFTNAQALTPFLILGTILIFYLNS